MFINNNAILLSEFEENLKRLGKSPSTINQYLVCLNCFIKEGYDFEKYGDYASFLEEHTIKKRSFNYYNILMMFVIFTYKDRKDIKSILIDTIKMIGKRRKDPMPRNSIVSEDEQMRMIQNMNTPKHQLIAWIQKETGVRAGDVIRTLKKNIKFSMYKDDSGNSSIVLDITFQKKGDRVSTIPLFNPHLIEYIKKHLSYVSGEEDYAFLDRSVVNKENVNSMFHLERRNYYLYYHDLRQSCESLGYKTSDFSTHDWRRNFANKIWVDVLHKTDIVALQRAMGHAHIETTTCYLRQSGLESREIYKHAFDLNNKK